MIDNEQCNVTVGAGLCSARAGAPPVPSVEQVAAETEPHGACPAQPPASEHAFASSPPAPAKTLVCIVCPQGCALTVHETEQGLTVTGNTCPRGAAFAKAELTHPMRSVTTTVATALPGWPVLPVRTDGEVPREKVHDVVHACADIVLARAVRCGDVVLENAAGTGVSLIATRTVTTLAPVSEMENVPGVLTTITTKPPDSTLESSTATAERGS